MRRAVNFRQVLQQTQGTPTESDLAVFIAASKNRITFTRIVMRLLGIAAFGLTAVLLFNPIPDEFQDNAWEALAFLVGFSLLIGLVVAVSTFLLNYNSRQEVSKASYALDSLAKAEEQITRHLNSDVEFFLCLRGFERERVGGSEKSQPLTVGQLAKIAPAMSYNQFGPTAADAQRSNDIRAQEYNWAWVRQLELLRAIRALRPVIVLDNFDLEHDKRRELEAAKIETLPTTSATWWTVFLELAARARLIVVLLEQRSPSVVRELDHLSSSQKPYLIVSTKGMVQALQRLAPEFIERAAASILLDDSNSATRQIETILADAGNNQASGERAHAGHTAGSYGREQRERQALMFAHSHTPVDWTQHEQVVSQLALRYSDVKWLNEWEKPVLIEQTYSSNLAGVAFGILLAVLGPLVSHFDADVPNFTLLGIAILLLSVIGLIIVKIMDWRSDRRRASTASRLQVALSGRNYKDLMNGLGIPEEEIQWVNDVLCDAQGE